MAKEVFALKTDMGFQDLIQPLRTTAFRKLQQNLVKNGSDEPIRVWRMNILEDFEMYTVCAKLQIPFDYREMDFSCREEAVVWICENQLRRRDLTDEWRKFLIGIQLETERVAIVIKKHSDLCFSIEEHEDTGFLPRDYLQKPLPSARSVALRIGTVNHISWCTVIKYAEYARYIEAVRRKNRELAKHILCGHYRVSHNSVATLSRMSKEQLGDIYCMLQKDGSNHSKYKNMRTILMEGPPAPENESPFPNPSVKDMPAYNPDAEIVALTYTVPSWGETIKRVREKVNVGAVTIPAKTRLIEALTNIMQEIRLLLEYVRNE